MRKFDLDYVDPDPLIGDWGWAQRPFISEIERQYNAGKPVRIIVLKARQLGISTATEAVLFLWAFLHRGSNSQVLSYEDGQAQELFQMTKNFWDHWPHNLLYTLKYSTKRQLRWEETGSQVRVATAKNSGGARGSTVHALHASEVAFWPDPETLWLGLNQTIPNRHGTIVVLESTANGVGNWFHEMWMGATEGVNEFVPMFFPFYKHSACRRFTTLSSLLELDVEEQNLFRLMSMNGLSDDMAYASIEWRRWAIINKCNGDIQQFYQEYPSTPEEAFITSGRPIFSWQKVRACFKEESGLTGRFWREANGKVYFEADAAGEWTVFRRPVLDSRIDRYLIAGDPSESVVGDPSCIQVINRGTTEQVAVYHGRTSPVHFAREMILAGDFYNHGILCPEVEGGGQATMATIINAGYDNIWAHHRPDAIKASFNTFGWSTTYNRKMWAIGTLQRAMLDESLTFHDARTFNQLIQYIEREDGTLGGPSKKIHDDAVMALSIAVTASRAEGMFLPEPHRTNNPYLDLFTSANLFATENMEPSYE